MAKTQTDRERVEAMDSVLIEYHDATWLRNRVRRILKAAGVDDADKVVAMLEALPRLVTTIEMQHGGWKSHPNDIKEMLAPFRVAQAARDGEAGEEEQTDAR